MKRSSGKKRRDGRRKYYLLSASLVLLLALVTIAFVLHQDYTASTATSKPVILYVNQGNGVVNESNFDSMLSYAGSHEFNTVFFQVYREGKLLFGTQELAYFVQNTHAQGMRIFFSLYFTNSSQQIPASVYSMGEDGINLDMSALSAHSQSELLSQLQSSYHEGLTAITTLNPNVTLKPDWLILETYGSQNDIYIHRGIIASVGVFTTSSRQEYQQEFQYALRNSDGVMVFDYAGMLKKGY